MIIMTSAASGRILKDTAWVDISVLNSHMGKLVLAELQKKRPETFYGLSIWLETVQICSLVGTDPVTGWYGRYHA